MNIYGGNRIPGVMFFLSLFLMLIFQKLLEKFIILVLIFSAGLYFYAKNETIKIHYSTFVTKVLMYSIIIKISSILQ